jgi:hypothetical protein
MSFFEDCMGDSMMNAGIVNVKVMDTGYEEGQFVIKNTKTKAIKTAKSMQPLSPEQVEKLGFGEYPDHEFLSLYTLDEIPLPTAEGQIVIISFNGHNYTLRKVLPWVWNVSGGRMGYFQYIISRHIAGLNAKNQL